MRCKSGQILASRAPLSESKERQMKANANESYPRSKKPKKNPGIDKAAAARQKRVDEMKAKPINDEIAQFANRLPKTAY